VAEDALEALVTAGAEMSALDRIHHEQQALLVAQLAESAEVLRGGGRDAALALDALDEDGGRGRRDGVAHGLEVVVGNLAEARNRRFEPLFDLGLPRGGDAGEGAAVEGVGGGEHLVTALVVAELAGELEQALVGLGARVGEEDLSWSQVADDA